MAMSSPLFFNTSACGLRESAKSEDPISGWPCWITSHPVLREIPSDLNYIPIHIRSTIPENGGKCKPQHLPCPRKSRITFIRLVM